MYSKQVRVESYDNNRHKLNIYLYQCSLNIDNIKHHITRYMYIYIQYVWTACSDRQEIEPIMGPSSNESKEFKNLF